MSDDGRRPAGWAGGRGRGWAGGRLRSPVGRREEAAIRRPAAPGTVSPGTVSPGTVSPGTVSPGTGPADTGLATADAANPARAGTADAAGTAPVAAGSAPAADGQPATGIRATVERAGAMAAEWAPVAGRLLLGLVLAWFGYHELMLPGEWTGYVPFVNEASSLAIVAVLVHGWVLFVLAVALIAGVAPRLSAAIASVLLLEIVISLSVSGLSDTSMRDVGVLGLAVCLTGCRNQRLVLRD